MNRKLNQLWRTSLFRQMSVSSYQTHDRDFRAGHIKKTIPILLILEEILVAFNA